jgi:hypothetical protein
LYLLEAVIADQLQGEAVFVEELEGRSYDGAFIGRFVIAPCVTFKEFDLVIVEGRCRTISSLSTRRWPLFQIGRASVLKMTFSKSKSWGGANSR